MALTKPPVKPAWGESGSIPADIVVPSDLEIQTGWPNSATPPSRQYFNWLLNFLANGVRYLTRRGIADWAADEPYLIGDCVRAANGHTYKATVNNTNESPETTPTKWTPWGLTSNLAHGVNTLKTTVASATTPNIFSVLVGNVIDYTGTVTCTGFVAAPQAGAQRTLICAGAAVFTAGANLLIDGVSSGSNYTAQAGERIDAIALTTTTVRLVIFKTLASNNIQMHTVQNSTSGTEINFTNIPAGTRRIVVALSGVSTNGTSKLLFQLGDAGGVENTGYLSAMYSPGSNTIGNSATGFAFESASAAAVLHGAMTFTLMNPATNTWVASGTYGRSDTTDVGITSGSKSLSAELTSVRITTVNGTDTFDAGTINVVYER